MCLNEEINYENPFPDSIFLFYSTICYSIICFRLAGFRNGDRGAENTGNHGPVSRCEPFDFNPKDERKIL
jgi:hypothetical protein